jgi:hypothetical protein
MPITRTIRTALCAALVLAQAFVGSLRAAPIQILAAQYRADVPFPEFEALWRKDSAPATNATPKATPTGGCIHLYLRNTNQQPVVVQDVLIEGISLTQAIAETQERKFKKHLRANSIYFSKLAPAEKQKLIALGEPVWWRVAPKTLAPGTAGEVLIRLRKDPPGARLNCVLKLADSPAQQIAVPTAHVADRCADVCFSPGLDTAWLYFAARENGRAPKHILLDGRDVTAACKIGTDAHLNLAPVVVHPPKAFSPASLHCFQAVYDDGATAIATIRAFPADFVYGLWGGKPGKADDPAVGRAFVQEIVAHNINLQMPGIGSPAVVSFYKSDEGRALLDKLGVRRVINGVGKGGTERPYAYYLADEPDAADSRVPGAPRGRQVGCLAQGLVGWSEELRREDPAIPHMLNVDYTFPPFNWHMYGQLPDIFAADPYYQPRLRQAFTQSPERGQLFGKATYVFAEAAICKSACVPRPLHIMLYGNRYEKGEDTFRGPTPPEKRIEAFYAIAAGAKGLSYWWYSPGKPAVGLGAKEPAAKALWREVGLIGAELRTAGPLITRSSPLALPMTAASPGLWVKTLAAGLDTLLVVVVNDDYTNDRQGTKINPVPNALLKFVPPAWLETKDAFEILSTGTKDIPHNTRDGQIELDLGTVNVTRLLVITSDPALRQTVQKDYEACFAANVKRLLAP